MNQKKKKGLAMAVALITLFILSVVAFALGSIGIQNMGESSRSMEDNAAFQLSRAGLNYAWYQFNNVLDGWTGYSSTTSTNCAIGTCGDPSTMKTLIANNSNASCSPIGGTIGTGTIPTKNLSTGSFSVTYYSNLLDNCGDPTGTIATVTDPDVGTINIPPGYIAVVSIGKATYGAVTGGAVVRRTLGMLAWNNTYNFAMGDVASFAVSGNLSTDSYNSDAPGWVNYATNCSFPCGYDGNIGTDSTSIGAIQIGGSSQINGVAVVGIGGTVTGGSATNPTGGWVQCDGCVNTRPVTIPSSITAVTTCPAGYACTMGGGGSYIQTIQDNSPTACVNTIPPGKYGDMMFSGNNKNIYLSPGNYSFSSITFKNGTTLFACVPSLSSPPTVVYLSNGLTSTSPQFVMNHSSIAVVTTSAPGTDTNRASHMLIYGNASFNSIVLDPGNKQYTMGLYAPRATYTGSGFGTIDVFGSIVINTLPPSSTGTIHFHADEALRRVFSLGNPILVRAFQADY